MFLLILTLAEGQLAILVFYHLELLTIVFWTKNLYICIIFTIIFNISYMLQKYNLLSQHLIVFYNFLVYLYQKTLIFSFECSFCLLKNASETVLNHCLHCFEVEYRNTRTPPRKHQNPVLITLAPIPQLIFARLIRRGLQALSTILMNLIILTGLG